MHCSWVTKHLSEYLDNELPADKCRQIEEHCAICSDCMNKLQSMTSFSKIFREAPAQLAPDGFADAVMIRIQAELPQSWFRQPFMVGFAEAFVAAVLIVAGLLSGSMLTNRVVASQAHHTTIAGIPSETFDPMPVASLAHSYLQVAEVRP